MVLRILNLEEQQNCILGSKVTTILTAFFQKKSKTSNVGMWGVYPEAIDWNIALHTQISFWLIVSKEKTLSEPKNLQNWPHFLKCFWDPTSDLLAKQKI